MKTITRILIAAALVLAPILARFLWFNKGFYNRKEPVPTPNYSELTIPEPPISTQPAPAEGDGMENYVVLVDFEHGNSFVLSEIENLTQPIVRHGARLEVSNFEKGLDERLKYADAYIVIAPTSAFSDYEIRAVNNFVQRGGRLLVIADPTRNYYASDPYSYVTSTIYLSGVDVANLLLAPYDIAFNEDYIYNLIENEANYRNVYFKDFGKSPITNDLSGIVLYGVHSLHTTQDVLISGDENTLSSSTDQGGGLAVAAAAADGNVFAIGDMSFLTVPYYQVEDNSKLISNLVDFLLSADRFYSLADFPYLFHNTVNIRVPDGDVLDKDFITTISDIQSMLKDLNLSYVVSEDTAEGEDLLVTGTYNQLHDLKQYIEPFKLKFSRQLIKEEAAAGSIFDTPVPTPTPLSTELWTSGPYGNTEDTVTVPGLGKFNINDVGLILFSSTLERNTLTLLASNPEAIRELADTVFEYRDLSTCLTTEMIAVCSLESGVAETDFYNDGSDYESGGGINEFEATPTPFGTEMPMPGITPMGSD